MSVYYLDSNSRLDHSVDWSAWLETGDAIATSEWLSPDGLTTDTPTVDGAVATVWLSGGEAGQRYRVTNRVTTTAGRIDDRTLHIRCTER